MQPPENPQGSTAGPQDVLTLHRGIYDRWLAENGRGMSPSQGPTGLALSSDRLMAHLPGLASMAGTFGSQAWDLATSVAHSPQLLAKLGLEARTLQVGDLADLLQLVLEEEELSQEALAVEQARSRTSTIEKQAAAARKGAQVQAKAQPNRAAPTRTQTAGRRPAPGQASKLRAIRQLLADLRTREARAQAALSGVSTPDGAGQVGRVDPDQPGTLRPTPGQAASVVQGRAESFGIVRTQASQGPQASRARMTADRWLDPASRVQDVASLPRSLRLAEQAAELALLEPGAEAGLMAGESAAAAWIEKEGSRSAAVSSRSAPRGEVSAPQSAGRAPVADARGAARPLPRAASVGPDARLPASAWAAAMARRPSSARPVAAAPEARAFAGAPAAAAPRAGSAPAADWTVPFAADRAIQAQAARAQALRAQASRSEAATSAPVASAVSPAASALPALGGAVAWAARQLNRWQRFEASASGARAAGAGSASQTPDAAGTSPAAGAPVASAGARAVGADRYAPLFARGQADAARGQAALPRWTAWLAKAEAALAGRSAATAPSDRGPARAGYAGADLGAGDWLVPADVGSGGSDDVASASASRAPAGARSRATAAVPAWIVPAAARAASAGTSSPAPRASASASLASAATGAESTRGATADAGSAFGAAPAAARSVGLVGLDSIGLGTRVSGRLLAGLEPVTSGLESGAWAPRAWIAAEAQAGRAAPRGFAGDLVADAGAGEWLVPGAEDAFEGTPARVEGASGRDTAARGRGVASRAGTATSTSTVAGSDAPAASRGTAAVRGGSPGRAGTSGRGAASTPAARAAWAGAAAAAIERVVAQSSRAGRLNDLMRHVAQGRSVVDFAAGAEAQVLAARPFGAQDAITPWIEQHLARQQVRAMANAGGDADLVALQPGLESDGATGEATSRAASAPAASSASGGGARPGARGARTAATPPATTAARTATGALEALRSPAAVRAALALFGDALPQGGGADVATAFLARWFGRADVARQTAQVLARSAGAGAMVGLRDDSAGTTETSARQAPAANATTGEAADGFVLTGLAALAAIRGPRQDIDQLANAAAPREMKTADVERELLAPTATSGEVAEAPAARTSTGRTARQGTTAQLHDFVPVGLRRGRDLLSSSRRAQGLMRVTPRSSLLGRSSMGSQARVGYGAAELGGGELIGLNAGETTSFYGESGPMPSAVRGADRLSGIVEARRSARTGRGHAAAVAANTGVQRTFTGGTEGPGGLPADFSYGEQGLVNPAAAMQAAVAQSGRNQGASAAMRSHQAGAMARVLSVTSTPGANMLPLVAPAASALVAAAAAKPLSESIVTSGSDPSMGMPLHDMGGKKKDAKGGGGGEGSHDGHHAEDLEALAQKIARSVMTRIKRERERRGIHG